MKILDRLREREGNAAEVQPVLIACLGDSVTHGCFEVYWNEHGEIDTRYDADQGYVALLQRRLNAYYPKAAVSMLNAGVSGGGAKAGELRAQRDVIARNPDLAIVNFGLNDSMGGLGEIEAYKSAMDGIFAQIQNAGIECMLLTPNRMCSHLVTDSHERRFLEIVEQASRMQNDGVLDAYVQAAREVAKRRGVPVADAYRRWNALEAAGVDTTRMLINEINHPNQKAHEIFVEAILDTMLTQ